uniref:Alternative protein TMEM90A n=1 Tax=Homo sapiens TaxID=9606 RepID=L8E754_HUMAN|nr:alternative protein TMEM90A [Homo sapiens]
MMWEPGHSHAPSRAQGCGSTTEHPLSHCPPLPRALPSPPLLHHSSFKVPLLY